MHTCTIRHKRDCRDCAQFAGYGKDSRSTHVFFTLGSQPGLGRSPWEVPVGKVTSGLDVMHGIYTGYGDRVDQVRCRTPTVTLAVATRLQP
jgi:hypothetical protein